MAQNKTKQIAKEKIERNGIDKASFYIYDDGGGDCTSDNSMHL